MSDSSRKTPGKLARGQGSGNRLAARDWRRIVREDVSKSGAVQSAQRPSLTLLVRRAVPPLPRARVQQLCYLAGSCGLLLRVVLWQLTEGTNDIRTWARFAQGIDVYGLGGTYVRDAFFNHPPPMGLLARAVWQIAPWLGMPFGKCFKLFGMFAELATALLLREIWLRRGQPDRAALAFAAYGCGLSGILVSGYHGNTDPVYWFLVLLTAYLLQDRSAPLLAGLTLGAALDVKLIPLLAVLPLAATCRTLSAAARFALGGCVALVPFVVPILGFSASERAAFVLNVFGYKSYRENWGIELILRAFVAAFQSSWPPLAARFEALGAAYAQDGSKLLLVLTTALALWQLRNRRPGLDAYAIAALSFCLFLVLASGFGVQYLGSVVPLLLARRIRDGFLVASVAGVFSALLYASFVRTWAPVYSEHNYFSAGLSPFAFATWWVIAICAIRIWRARAWAADAG
jgi:hypothetical protein